VFGVRTLARWGVPKVLLTNAAGGIARDLRPGSLLLIEDHLNLTGQSPLRGPNDDSLGPRFPDMTDAYCPRLRGLAKAVAADLAIPLTEGVYAGLLGPTYETPAEIRMLRALGASAVGMSTVLETIALRHMGVRVLGLSCITNLAAGLGSEKLSHDEVAREAGRAKESFENLILGVCRRLDEGEE
jgi:purine-nucleoside phosphorylase